MGNRRSIGGLKAIELLTMNAIIFNSNSIIKKISLIILFTNLFSQSIFQILNQPSDAKTMALLNGASAMPSNIISSNPASIETDIIMLRITQIKLPADIHINEISFINNWKKGAIFGKIKTANYGKIIDGINNNETNANDVAIEIGYKTNYLDLISIGITSGYITSQIAESRSTGIFTNLGMRFHIVENRIGLVASLNNMGTQLVYYENTPEPLPTSFRTGLYFMPLHLPAMFNVDILKNIIEDELQYIGGIEFHPLNNLVLRISSSSLKKELSTGEFYTDFFSGIAMGMGIITGKIEIDLSVHNMGPAGLAMGLTLGWRQL